MNKTSVFRLQFFVIAVAVLLAPNVARATMTLNSYSASKHYRFYSGAGKAFIGDPYNWSGVGRTTGLLSYWATMISPSYFLSAEHYHPGNGETLYFYYGNSTGGGSETRTVASGQQIGGTDLWIGKLSAPVGANVAKYPLLRTDPFAYPYSGYDNRVLYTFGLNDGPLFAPASSMRLGRNNLEPGGLGFRYVSNTYCLTMDYNRGAGGLGADESYLEQGDSGGPSFAIVGGAPALVGLHYVNDLTSYVSGLKASGDTFVPYYVDHLTAAMAGSGESLMLVPEPGTLALLGCAVVALLAYAWRKRK